MNEIDWLSTELLEKTSDRYKYCGRKFKRINPKKPDEMIEFTFICDDYRNCGWCLREKALQEKRILYDGLIKENTNLVISKLSTHEAKCLNRRLRDRDVSYRNFPQANDEIIVLHCDESEPGQIIDNEDDFYDLPLESWIKNIPRKRRISGRRHMIAQKVAAKEKKEGVVFGTFALWTDAPKEDEEACWQQAVSDTPYEESLEDCLRKRMRRYKELLERKGHVIYSVPIRIILCTERQTIPQKE